MQPHVVQQRCAKRTLFLQKSMEKGTMFTLYRLREKKAVSRVHRDRAPAARMMSEVTYLHEPKHIRKEKSGELGFFLWAVFVYMADRLSKRAVISTIGYRESIPVIPGFFHLTHILNAGASFGILRDRTEILIWATGFVLVLNCWVVFFWKDANRPMRILLGAISGGALGNLADRLIYGAVVDFLDFRGIWAYIFNLADVAVVCGGILLGLLLLLDDRVELRHKPKH